MWFTPVLPPAPPPLPPRPVSGVVPEEPVVCTKSGFVYEKRLITKHVEISGTEPVTGEPITADDLLPLRGPKVARPRPAASTSVAGLLSNLQSEWDGMMLESHALRSALESTRQELSQALYQHDGACRVIARLIRERDSARVALSGAQAALARSGGGGGGAGVGAGAASADVSMDGGATAAADAAEGVTQSTLQAITDKHKELSKAVRFRVARPLPHHHSSTPR